jgi:hypothetical protein
LAAEDTLQAPDHVQPSVAPVPVVHALWVSEPVQYDVAAAVTVQPVPGVHVQPSVAPVPVVHELRFWSAAALQ